MNRTALSSKFIANKVLTVILAIAVLIIWIFYLPFVRFLLIGAVIVAVVGFIAFIPRINIEFDDQNMYIRDQGSETIVALKEVTMLSITNFTFNNRHKWKVVYRHDGIEEEAAFYPGFYSNLDKFADLVQQKNPEAQIIRSSSTF